MKDKKIIQMNEISNNYITLDIQTTGLYPSKGSKIIEIGAVKIKDGKCIDTFNALINPEDKITSKITKLTGITNEMVEFSEVYPIVLKNLKEFINDLPIVSLDINFDWERFLLYFFYKSGIVVNNQTINITNMCKELNKDIKKCNLNTLVEKYNIQLENEIYSIPLKNSLLTYLIYEKMKNLENIKETDNYLIKEEKTIVKPKVYVKRVKYWEKKIGKNKSIKRIYVNVVSNNCFGKVYFDVVKRVWYNVDFKSFIDFADISKQVLKITKCHDEIELSSFRN